MKQMATFKLTLFGNVPEGETLEEQARLAEEFFPSELELAVTAVLAEAGALEKGDVVKVEFEEYVGLRKIGDLSVENDDGELETSIAALFGACEDCDERECPDRSAPYRGAADDPEDL